MIKWNNFNRKNSRLKKCAYYVPKLIYTSVACAICPSVTSSSIGFSFQNLVFWNLFEFLVIEIILKSKSPTFWIQILLNKFHSILLIKIFPTTPKAHFIASPNVMEPSPCTPPCVLSRCSFLTIDSVCP